jgi:hypothetical protein
MLKGAALAMAEYYRTYGVSNGVMGRASDRIPSMGRRSRQRGRAERLVAPSSDYADERFGVLTLRGSLTAKTRERYARALAGEDDAPGAAREDAWQRAVELLFERLAVRWEIAGVPTEGQRELLMRFRVATQDERRWVREVLRAHVAEHFPELAAP